MPNILSPLQASVVQWLVQPGRAVAAGDVLVILEAMKMEHEVRAPAAGRVTHLCFAVGELVQEKDVLLNWELLAHIPRGLEVDLASNPAVLSNEV
ncbi:MAG: acetyl-CoA carboxylase biotin carboxyl carrier protein subunit [Rhodoferax sp.]|nr:acetyl-CoA carboxylase biotin carboxyl carrier protein subunit [Rhodoferax sp.]